MSSDGEKSRSRSPVDRKKRRVSESAGAKNDMKVFVSNFPYDVKWQDLKDLFRDEVGEVAHVELFKDSDGRPRGTAIVEFSSKEHVEEAIKIVDKKEWKGRKLSVKEAVDAERDKFGNIIKAGSNAGNKSRSKGSGNSANRVYISNLPFELKWQDIKDLFRTEVGEVCFVEMFSDERGKNRGCGIMEFENKEMADKAIQKMNKFELKGRKILVQEAMDHQRDKYGYIIKDGKSGGHGGGRDRDRRGRSRDRSRRSRDRSQSGPRNFGYTYGLSAEFLESLGIDGPLNTKVFVANLAFSVDDDKIREIFKLAGRLVKAEVVKDREGKSRGYAIVDYSHPVEAVQAISMFNNQRLYERSMGVRFDRDPVPEERLPNRLPEGLEGVGMGLGAGGKPLTDVVKNLMQNDLSGQKVETAQNGVNALADLTPALAILAQQMSMNMTANQVGANQGINIPTANQGNFGYNNPPQQNIGYSTNQNPGYNGNMSQQSYSNIGSGRAGAGNSLASGYPSINPAISSSRITTNPAVKMAYAPVPSPYSGASRPVESASSIRPSFDTVMVRNLPPEMEWQDLQDFFSSCGEVKNAMIKERGVGLVRFADERSAERALTFDQQSEWGRTLDVRIF